MTKRMLILLLTAVGAAGCMPTYRVHVNAFAQFKEPLGHGAPIYVAVDPNSRNPILAQKIATKIRTMLQDQGYNAAEKAEGAQYTLTFRAGVNMMSYLDYLPVAQPFGGYYGVYGGFYRGYGFGYTTYLPYIETIYTHWMDVRLYPGPGKDRTQPIWIGEAIVGMDEPESRRAVNYLLVGLMEYFGEDTEHWVTVTLKENDPRVLAVAGVP
jgi:hypothetical protein